jgi:hypothetical protein
MLVSHKSGFAILLIPNPDSRLSNIAGRLFQFSCAVWTACSLDRNGCEAIWAFLADWVRRRWSFFGGIGRFDDQEDHEGDYEEVNNGLNECTPFDNRRANR